MNGRTHGDLGLLILAVSLSAPLGLGCGPEEPTEPEHGSGSMSGSGSGSEASSTSAATGSHDESGSSTEQQPGTVPLYDSCDGEGQDCLPGLLCAPIAMEPGGGTSMICTVECHDPAVDCAAPPDGFEAVCNGFLHMIEPDPFCAIGCTETGACPAGMECVSDSPPYTEPLYCVPS